MFFCTVHFLHFFIFCLFLRSPLSFLSFSISNSFFLLNYCFHIFSSFFSSSLLLIFFLISLYFASSLGPLSCSLFSACSLESLLLSDSFFLSIPFLLLLCSFPSTHYFYTSFRYLFFFFYFPHASFILCIVPLHSPILLVHPISISLPFISSALFLTTVLFLLSLIFFPPASTSLNISPSADFILIFQSRVLFPSLGLLYLLLFTPLFPFKLLSFDYVYCIALLFLHIIFIFLLLLPLLYIYFPFFPHFFTRSVSHFLSPIKFLPTCFPPLSLFLSLLVVSFHSYSCFPSLSFTLFSPFRILSYTLLSFPFFHNYFH